MADLDPTDDRPKEAADELQAGAAAAAAYGSQQGITMAGSVGSGAAGAVAGQMAADATMTDRPDLDAVQENTADSGDSFAGEGNPHPEPSTESRGISAHLLEDQ